MILKVLPETPGSPTGWNYPAREALAYERGLLEDLPPGLRAPRCFGHTEHRSQHQLWLEDLGRTRRSGGSRITGRRPDRSDGSMARSDDEKRTSSAAPLSEPDLRRSPSKVQHATTGCLQLRTGYRARVGLIDGWTISEFQPRAKPPASGHSVRCGMATGGPV